MTAKPNSLLEPVLAKKGDICLITGMVLHAIAWNTIPLSVSKDLAFQLLAIAVVCYGLGALYGVSRPIAVLFIGLAISNLADELFFNPYSYSWNEYAGAILALAFCFYELSKSKTE